MKITRPTLLIDEAKCRNNIRRMADRAASNGLIFRPHFKTHQSLEVGEWIREAGADQCTVSSVQMAGYFADGGWKDITVAFPLNALEVEEINRIAGKAQLNVLAIEPESLLLLLKDLRNPVGVFIEIDAGYHRTGVDPSHYGEIDAILAVISSSRFLSFKGFLTHAGQSYAARSKEAILKVHEAGSTIMRQVGEHYHKQFPDLVVSSGDTPACSVAEHFDGIDEMRPGNFVFYDIMQRDIGSCSPEDIAVAMACPVVAVLKDRREIIVHCGGVHLSKDFLKRADGSPTFGDVVRIDDHGWETVIHGYAKSLSQEHGILSVDDELLNSAKVGDVLGILPVHSCMTADCMGEYYTLEGRRISMMRKAGALAELLS